MSLYKRKDSPYWWIKLPPIRGELKNFYQSTETTNKRQAQRLHDKLCAERWELDKIGVKPARTWDDATVKWLEETSYKRTHEWDKSMIRWFKPHLSGRALNTINRELLDEVKRVRSKGVTPSTVNRYMALVRSILRRACYDWEWIERVPKVGMMRQAEGRVRSLKREEFAKLLAELPPHLADMAIFSVATGLRQANVKRLQWKQVSLERRHLWVAADQHKNGQAHAVPLNETAMGVLIKRRADHPVYVFTFEGRPVEQVATLAWRKALKRAGIVDFRWHDLRHTFATWHREAGTPTYELQRLGGWKTQSMVERYAHLAPDGLLSAAERLESFFG